MVVPPEQRPEAPTPAANRRRKIYKTAVLLAALGGLTLLLDHIGWAKIGHHLSSIPTAGIAVLLLLGLLESLGDAAGLGAALSARVHTLRLLVFHQAGAIVNILVPWEAGELLKGKLLSHFVPGRDAIVATVVWNYVFKLTKPAAAITAAAVGALFAEPEFRETSLLMMAAAFAALLPYAGMRLAVRLGPAGIVVGLARRLRLLRKADPEALLLQAKEIDNAVRYFWRERRAAYLLVFVTQYAARVASWLALWAILVYIAPGHGWSFALSGTIYAGFAVMSYFVMLFPTRMGTTEASGYALFYLLGLDPDIGLIAQLVTTLKSIASNLLAGFVFVDKVSGGASFREPPPQPATLVPESADTSSTLE